MSRLLKRLTKKEEILVPIQAMVKEKLANDFKKELKKRNIRIREFMEAAITQFLIEAKK